MTAKDNLFPIAGKIKRMHCNKYTRYHNLFEALESHQDNAAMPGSDEPFAKSLIDLATDVREKQVVKGIIKSIDKGIATLEVGGKSEGKIPVREFSIGEHSFEPEVGSECDVFVERLEGRDGTVSLSREKAVRAELWNRLRTAHENNEIVSGNIVGTTKNGYSVDINGVTAFLLASHVDVKPLKDASHLFGKKLEFLILKMQDSPSGGGANGGIMVSRKAVIELSHAVAREQFVKTLKEGDIIEGEVKSITDYGVFIGIYESDNIGALDGLLHINDISWSRIAHPSAEFSCGQRLRAKIIKIDNERCRISLGVKQLEENPWENIEERCKVNGVYTGHVTSIEHYGVFVEIYKGIEGLVHISEISWKNALPMSRQFIRGQEVKVKVLSIDSSKNRMSLSIKRCQENPWQIFASTNPAGTVLKGTIAKIVDFGIFVNLPFDDSQMDGLVYVNDLTWDRNPERLLKNYKVGDEIEVKILNINIFKGKISLGVKQLSFDPFEQFLKKVEIGDVIKATCNKIDDSGIFFEVEGGALTFIEQEFLPQNRKFVIGEEVTAEVLTKGVYSIIFSVVDQK